MKKLLLLTFLAASGFVVSAQNLVFSGGTEHSVMLCDDGGVYTYGNNNDGDLGIGSTGGAFSTPQQVVGVGGTGFLENVKQVDAGSGSHNIALTCSGDSVVTWGLNTSGQLGNNTLISSDVPVRVVGVGCTGFLTGVQFVSGGNEETFALMNDGRVVAWGDNSSGQLGRGTTTASETCPGYVQKDPAFGGGDLTDIKFVDGGDDFAVALDNNGNVWFWGKDARGVGGQNVDLADPGTARTLAVPVMDATGTGLLQDIVMITAGDRHIMALSSTDTLWAWGANWGRQIGNNNGGTNQPVPAPVLNVNNSGGVLSGVVAIAAGNAHSLAVLGNGRMVAWGLRRFGQLGDGQTLPNGSDGSPYPVYVLDPTGTNPITGIRDLSEGDNWSFALDSADRVFVWGENPFGQLGLGFTSADENLPIEMTLPCTLAQTTRSPEANLGPNQEVCGSTTTTLDAGDSGPDYVYEWYYEGVLMSGETNRTLTVNQEGEYKVIIKDPRDECGVLDSLVSSDSVQVLFKDITPDGDTICPGQQANLAVIGTGEYKWFDAATGGNAVATGNTYTTPALGATTTYYVEDTSSFSAHVGPTTPLPGGNGRDPYGTDDNQLVFRADAAFNLDSVTVGAYHAWDGDFAIEISVIDSASGSVVDAIWTPVLTGSVNPTEHQVLVDIAIPGPGTYYLRYTNSTNGDDRLHASSFGTYNPTDFPWCEPGVVCITRNHRNTGAIDNNRYSFFWDWVISSGNICGRTPVVATVDCPLPVEFLQFDVEKQGEDALLTWSTATEENNDYFVVERSDDGINFYQIGIVSGSGTTSNIANYNFVDENPLPGTSYYRLRQVDYDGSFAYSGIRSINFTAGHFHAYPNPFGDQLTIGISASGEVHIQVVNVEGKTMVDRTINADQVSEIKLGSDLAVGVYFVKIVTQDGSEVIKVVKSH